MMNRQDILQLLFWVPIGILSFLYLAMDQTWLAAAEAPTTTFSYLLIENTTMVNTYGDHCKVLRYTAQEQLHNKSYVPVSTVNWAQENRINNAFVDLFFEILAQAPMNAFFFETRGVTSFSNANNAAVLPFEFVLVESHYLYNFADAKQDSDTFSQRFQECNESHPTETNACVFTNPTGDSVLIAPLPLLQEQQQRVDSNATTNENNNVYGHLAAFVRRAPKDQIIQFWKVVMQVYLERIKSMESSIGGGAAVWLSTDGSGVAWLHVRLDPRPKYYDYKPYTQRG